MGLRDVVESVTATLDQRVAAGEALALEGDPRATAVDRVRVHRCSVDRYPVTVAAYSEFLAAGGYGEANWWSAAGWTWREAESIRKPRFWDDAAWATYLVPNHPVVGVSFHEAEAYAAFRGVRLPTEAEWEAACRGDDGRRYPWGPDWQDDACGVRNVGPRGTLPIGVFPRGQSPCGALDLVGCVWQWCVDQQSMNESAGGAATRVARGGGWNNLQWSLSCESRNAFPPTARFSNLGFRCVSESAATPPR